MSDFEMEDSASGYDSGDNSDAEVSEEPKK